MNRTRPTSKPTKQRVSPILIPCLREWMDVTGNKREATDVSGMMVAAVPVVREFKLGDAQLTGVENDFDAKPTGVELEELEVATDSYGKAYDAVPQEQGNKIEVYGLGQQGPTESMVFVENDIEKYKIQVPTSMAKQRLDKPTRVKHRNIALA